MTGPFRRHQGGCGPTHGDCDEPAHPGYARTGLAMSGDVCCRRWSRATADGWQPSARTASRTACRCSMSGRMAGLPAYGARARRPAGQPRARAARLLRGGRARRGVPVSPLRLRHHAGVSQRTLFGSIADVEDLAAKRQFFTRLIAKCAARLGPSARRPARIERDRLYAITPERMTGKRIALPALAQRWPAVDRPSRRMPMPTPRNILTTPWCCSPAARIRTPAWPGRWTAIALSRPSASTTASAMRSSSSAAPRSASASACDWAGRLGAGPHLDLGRPRRLSARPR